MTTLAARFPPTPFATTARSPLSLCGMLGLSFNYVVLQSLTTDPFLCSTGIRTRPSKLFHVCVGVLSLVSSGVAVSQRSQQISCVVFRARSCRSPRRASRHRPPGQLERSLHVFTTVTRSLCYWRAVFGSTCRTLHIKLSTRGPLHV
ncbi:hypothetical protein BD310DRAFT_411907 [Dichomitus squalens]|uniref:Uncharacterized protein n=1 Tax=Dichomitus squalens TaxID=114155 RepID=A0A4Q9P945_9APHY|nr:hypothetical protein BD310DRAFT_411907 [Dichomitus squalens]